MVIEVVIRPRTDRGPAEFAHLAWRANVNGTMFFAETHAEIEAEAMAFEAWLKARAK